MNFALCFRRECRCLAPDARQSTLADAKVMLELEGYRRGKMNDALPASTSQPIQFLDFTRQ